MFFTDMAKKILELLERFLRAVRPGAGKVALTQVKFLVVVPQFTWLAIAVGVPLSRLQIRQSQRPELKKLTNNGKVQNIATSRIFKFYMSYSCFELVLNL